MAIAVVASGSLVADGTEQTLATSTTGKTYVLVVDLNPMVNGDEIELRLKTKVLTGSTERLAYFAGYAHIQAAPNKYSVPVPANWSCKATLKQVAGSNHTYDWALLSID